MDACVRRPPAVFAQIKSIGFGREREREEAGNVTMGILRRLDDLQTDGKTDRLRPGRRITNDLRCSLRGSGSILRSVTSRYDVRS